MRPLGSNKNQIVHDRNLIEALTNHACERIVGRHRNPITRDRLRQIRKKKTTASSEFRPPLTALTEAAGGTCEKWLQEVMISQGVDPNRYYSKNGFRKAEEIGEDRALELQRFIRSEKLEHAVSGRSVAAMGHIWYQALKDAPRDSRAARA